jgi:hypothetical protein
MKIAILAIVLCFLVLLVMAAWCDSRDDEWWNK